jgi:hypothetical protein
MSTYVTGFGLDAVRGYPYLASSSKHLSTRTYVTGFGLDAVRGYPYLATGFGLDAVRGYPYLASSSSDGESQGKHRTRKMQWFQAEQGLYSARAQRNRQEMCMKNSALDLGSSCSHMANAFYRLCVCRIFKKCVPMPIPRNSAPSKSAPSL